MSELTYTANADGYMIYYMGRPIGGAGVKLPRDRPLRGQQARKNAAMFSEDARREINDIRHSVGQKRFMDAIEEINKSLVNA